jgi:repressor LexA
MAALTKIQKRVFDLVRDRLTTGQSAPTRRELAEEFGWSSSRAAACHIEAIIRKGLLLAEPGKARSFPSTL